MIAVLAALGVLLAILLLVRVGGGLVALEQAVTPGQHQVRTPHQAYDA